ncbi:hypothetical protein [Wolbachia endosymbiont of Folsomia candida]|nr:hypothetical protein [Wolbachia endosymbiont of Folsomia candida]
MSRTQLYELLIWRESKLKTSTFGVIPVRDRLCCIAREKKAGSY